MDKKKVLWIAAGLVAAGAAAYFIFKPDIKGMYNRLILGVPADGEEVKVGSSKGIATGGSSTSVSTSSSSSNAISSVIPQVTNTPIGNCPSYKAESFPLKKGMKGEKTKAMQLAINKIYKKSLTVDGCLGPNTETAIKAVTGSTSMSLTDYQKLIMSYSSALMLNPLG